MTPEVTKTTFDILSLKLQKILDFSSMLVKCSLKAPVTQMCDDFLDLPDTSLHFNSKLSLISQNEKHLFKNFFLSLKNRELSEKTGPES